MLAQITVPAMSYDVEARMPVDGGVTKCETVTVPLPRIDKSGGSSLVVKQAHSLINVGAPSHPLFRLSIPH
ncbi:hypothetical protein GCM10022293_11980 [Azospirillum formosense]